MKYIILTLSILSIDVFACKLSPMDDEYLKNTKTLILGDFKDYNFVGEVINNEKNIITLEMSKSRCSPQRFKGHMLFISEEPLEELKAKQILLYDGYFFNMEDALERKLLHEVLGKFSKNPKNDSFKMVWGICEKDSDCLKANICGKTYNINSIFKENALKSCPSSTFVENFKCKKFYCSDSQ